MTLEELQKQMEGLKKTFDEKLDLQVKSFQVQLDGEKKQVEQWKTVAQAKEEEARVFAEKAKKADEEKAKAFAEAKKAEMKAFFEQAKKEGRITPALEEIAVKLAESMTSETVIATFEKNDGSKTTHTQMSLFKAFISGLGKTTMFREQSRTPQGVAPATPGSANGGDGAVEFAEVIYGGIKKQLPMDGNDLHARAVQFQDAERTAGRSTSYEQALIEVSKQDRMAGRV